ncbi:glycosyltransferase [Streptomyces sp. NPDC094448]|uniref:glycosyltransferase n=1 Tax=Streptomyces sp. NPDC094448 TaxID=3366063 RepID=UPI0037F78315
MRIGLLTDGGCQDAFGGSAGWCDRLVRGLAQHEFDVYAGHAVCAGGASGASGTGRAADPGARCSSPAPSRSELPPQVRTVRTAPAGPADRDGGAALGRRERRRFLEHFSDLVTAVRGAGNSPAGSAGPVDSAGSVDASGAAWFAEGLYGLAELAREHGGLAAALRSEPAVRTVESVCRTPGAQRSVHTAAVTDYLAFAGELERALRPLSFDWYGDEALGAVDLCHAVSGGTTALPGLLAKRFFGVPLLVTEYGVDLRAHYLATGIASGNAVGSAVGHSGGAGTSAGVDTLGRPGAPAGPYAPGVFGPPGVSRPRLSAPVRALLAGFRRALAAEVYSQAALITPGDARIRRWQRKCGADPAKLRTVHPGVDADRYAAVGEAADPGDPYTLVWMGRTGPGKDLVGLLHAFADVHRREPRARLRLFARPAAGEEAGYLAHCRSLAAHLFADGGVDVLPAADSPVSFEPLGGDGGWTTAEACASGAVAVSASSVEGFPHTLVEAMLCGRATVSTDAGAVVEVIGGTGLVVPPRSPRALADACLALLGDPARTARLGAAARSRALELFTSNRNTAAFRALYLEVISRAPVHRDTVGAYGEPLPFARPAETLVPVRWGGSAPYAGGGSLPRPSTVVGDPGAGPVGTGGTWPGTVVGAGPLSGARPGSGSGSEGAEGTRSGAVRGGGGVRSGPARAGSPRPGAAAGADTWPAGAPAWSPVPVPDPAPDGNVWPGSLSGGSAWPRPAGGASAWHGPVPDASAWHGPLGVVVKEART